MGTENSLKVVFLDRDGVININHGHVGTIDRFDFIDGSIDAMVRIRKAGYEIIVVTNQAGIAKGYYSLNDYHKLTGFMRVRLSGSSIEILSVYFCPHHPDGSVVDLSVVCGCRKPAPGMFIEASNDYDLDLGRSFIIGDKYTDIAAGQAAGVGNFGYVGEEVHVPQALAGLNIINEKCLLACVIKMGF
jgi:D-glycero-D-manno-heptose 1,7-bisphosphate phosphatase